MTPPLKTLTALALVAAAAPVLASSHAGPATQFLNVWDIDADGTATFEELVEMRGTVFSMFDMNEDGVLDADDYAAFDETREADVENHQGPAQGRNLMQQIADGLGLGPNDANGDGIVTRDEFIAGTQSWLELIDHDGDGAVTSADFQR